MRRSGVNINSRFTCRKYMEKFEIEYFTDPLCSWSWGLEPALRKLRYLLHDRIEMNYIMGGLLRDWDSFSDEMNNVSRPSHFGPLWMETKHISGQPIDDSIWMNDPVDSSYPACLAVKAAGMQSRVAEEAMLRHLREAVMINRRNIGETEVLFEIAETLEAKGILDLKDFRKKLLSDKVSDLLREDLNLVKIKGISRFPSMLITYEGRTVQITGYRPFQVLLDTFRLLEPGLEIDQRIDKSDYISSWASLTEQELKIISTESNKEEPVNS